MVPNWIEAKVRAELERRNATVPNLIGRPTARPSTENIFRVGDKAVAREQHYLNDNATDVLALPGIDESIFTTSRRRPKNDRGRGGLAKCRLPKSDVLAFDLADGGRVLARPSGTEPKIKFYVEVLEAFPESATLAEVEARAQVRIVGIGAEVVGMATG